MDTRGELVYSQVEIFTILVLILVFVDTRGEVISTSPDKQSRTSLNPSFRGYARRELYCELERVC